MIYAWTNSLVQWDILTCADVFRLVTPLTMNLSRAQTLVNIRFEKIYINKVEYLLLFIQNLLLKILLFFFDWQAERKTSLLPGIRMQNHKVQTRLELFLFTCRLFSMASPCFSIFIKRYVTVILLSVSASVFSLLLFGSLCLHLYLTVSPQHSFQSTLAALELIAVLNAY